ncbi:MAG TPA: hypothetical protein VF575_05020 [Candidatus Saccharimonadales bacterium]|jgi:hypothetical protein
MTTRNKLFPVDNKFIEKWRHIVAETTAQINALSKSGAFEPYQDLIAAE